MRRPATTPIVGTLVAAATLLLSSQAATSQTTTNPDAADQASNTQVQLGDVFAGTTLQVDSASSGASASAAAVANSAIASGQNSDLDFESSQSVQGNVTAQTQAAVNGDAGPSYSTASEAVGNTSDAGTCCGTVSGNVSQSVGAVTTSALTSAYSAGYTDEADATAIAIGNTQGYATVNGGINTTTTQVNNGATKAEVDANVADEGSNGSTYVANATANDVEASASNSPANMSVTQTQAGYITDAKAYAVQNSASDISTTAAATANNFNVVSDSYADVISANQTNQNDVYAASNLQVAGWTGTGSASAYGVGNSTLVSNSGSYTGVDAAQTNNGAITVNASFNGGAGGDAYAAASGVGNAVSGYACASCNGTFNANSSQVNSAGVSATSSVTGGSVGVASGSSSAVGNTATFQVKSSH